MAAQASSGPAPSPCRHPFEELRPGWSRVRFPSGHDLQVVGHRDVSGSLIQVATEIPQGQLPSMCVELGGTVDAGHDASGEVLDQRDVDIVSGEEILSSQTRAVDQRMPRDRYHDPSGGHIETSDPLDACAALEEAEA
jgi:hypothetical protein